MSYLDRPARKALETEIQALGPVYAAAFGPGWTYEDPRKPDDESGWERLGFTLAHSGGARVSLSAYDGKMTASPSMPDKVTGGRSFWRDYRPTVDGTVGGERVPEPTAGVSLDRFRSEPAACARRFVKLVAAPLLAIWPRIEAQLATERAGYAERDRVVAWLCETYGGSVHEPHGRGADSVRVYFQGKPMGALNVSYGGHMRPDHAPTFNERQIAALFNLTAEVTP